MKIISKRQTERTQTTGRLSDGSDRTTVTIISWEVEVEADGRVYTLTFSYNPTDQEIIDQIPEARELVPSTAAGWLRIIDNKYSVWQMWKQTRLEAEARGLPAQVIARVTTKENTAWANYVQALQNIN